MHEDKNKEWNERIPGTNPMNRITIDAAALAE